MVEFRVTFSRWEPITNVQIRQAGENETPGRSTLKMLGYGSTDWTMTTMEAS
jgi:hypothetical protein